jgi:hypothetical protein
MAVSASPASAKVIAVINLSNLLMRGLFLSTFIPLTSRAVFASPASAKVMAVIILSSQLMLEFLFSISTPPLFYCCSAVDNPIKHIPCHRERIGNIYLILQVFCPVEGD